MVVGAILSATGIMGVLSGWAEGGIMVMLPVAGDAVYNIATAILNGAGFGASVSFILLIIFLYIAPCLFGILRHKRNQSFQDSKKN